MSGSNLTFLNEAPVLSYTMLPRVLPNTNAAAHVRLQRPAEALRRQRDHHIHDVKQRRGKAKPARNCYVSNALR